jgi:mevalonate kinase
MNRPSTQAGPETTATACGNVILLGEHAVEYGVPALAAGIDRGVRAVAKPTSGTSSLTVAAWHVAVTADEPSDLGRAFRAVIEGSMLGPPLAIEAFVDLPSGSGMGGSAALGVAVARAIDPEATPSEIMVRAMAWEEVFHPAPSGLDAAVASRGGCIVFSKGQGIESMRVGLPLTLCIGHSGEVSSSNAMVVRVAERRRERRGDVEAAFDGIRDLVAASRFAVHTGDRRALGRLMNLNQTRLGDLGLSTPAIEQMCRLARAHGAFGAKLTGGGGGGSVVALVNGGHGAWQVLDAWRGAGFDGFVTRVAPSQSLVDVVEDVRSVNFGAKE